MRSIEGPDGRTADQRERLSTSRLMIDAAGTGGVVAPAALPFWTTTVSSASPVSSSIASSTSRSV